MYYMEDADVYQPIGAQDVTRKLKSFLSRRGYVVGNTNVTT